MASTFQGQLAKNKGRAIWVPGKMYLDQIPFWKHKYTNKISCKLIHMYEYIFKKSMILIYHHILEISPNRIFFVGRKKQSPGPPSDSKHLGTDQPLRPRHQLRSCSKGTLILFTNLLEAKERRFVDVLFGTEVLEGSHII